jgi:hypothetical protein
MSFFACIGLCLEEHGEGLEGIRRADYTTPLYIQTLALTSPKSGCLWVGMVRTRTQAKEFVLFEDIIPSVFGLCEEEHGNSWVARRRVEIRNRDLTNVRAGRPDHGKNMFFRKVDSILPVYAEDDTQRLYVCSHENISYL